MSDAIPFLDLPGQHRPLLAEIQTAVRGLMEEARFIGGPPIQQFEGAFAEYCGVGGCVGVANGTDALMLALRVLGVKQGDVVLVPAHTFIATAEAASAVGATVRFVDIDPVTYTMSPEALGKVDKKDVRAVIPVHLYGQPAAMDRICEMSRRNGWLVVEDAAQAHGAAYAGRSVGSWGDLTGFSFYPGKNLGAFGDGGAVVGQDLEKLDHLRRVADHGRQTKQLHGEPGVNSRLDSIQAAILGIKLAHLEEWNEARRKAAGWYNERLEGVAGVEIPQEGEGRRHVYHLYVIQVPNREKLQERLAEEGIGTGIHYATPLHLQPAYADLGHHEGDFPVAEQVTGSCLSLPMFPGLTEEQVDRVTRVVVDFAKAGG